MIATTEELREKLLQLPREDRAALAKLLIESLDDESDDISQEEYDEAWTAELNRREAEVDSGRVVGIPAEEVMERLRIHRSNT